jgi:hypothetical protein
MEEKSPSQFSKVLTTKSFYVLTPGLSPILGWCVPVVDFCSFPAVLAVLLPENVMKPFPSLMLWINVLFILSGFSSISRWLEPITGEILSEQK